MAGRAALDLDFDASSTDQRQVGGPSADAGLLPGAGSRSCCAGRPIEHTPPRPLDVPCVTPQRQCQSPDDRARRHCTHAAASRADAGPNPPAWVTPKRPTRPSDCFSADASSSGHRLSQFKLSSESEGSDIHDAAEAEHEPPAKRSRRLEVLERAWSARRTAAASRRAARATLGMSGRAVVVIGDLQAEGLDENYVAAVPAEVDDGVKPGAFGRRAFTTEEETAAREVLLLGSGQHVARVRSVVVMAEQLKVDGRWLQRVQSVAAIRCFEGRWQALLQLLQGLAAAQDRGELSLLQFVHSRAYDETPEVFRTGAGSSASTCKVLACQARFSMLMMRPSPSESVGPSEFCVLRGQLPSHLVSMPCQTAEVLGSTLHSVGWLPEPVRTLVESVFSHVARVSTCDSHRSNLKVERVAAASAPKWASMTIPCRLHRCHTVQQRAYQVDRSLESGLVNFTLNCRTPGVWARMRQSTTAWLQRNMRIYHGQLPAEAREWRQQIREWFLTSSSAGGHRRRGVLHVFDHLLNGDVRRTDECQHWCNGCHRSDEEARQSVAEQTVSMLFARMPAVFPRKSWRGSPEAMFDCAALASMHGLLQRAYAEAHGHGGPPLQLPQPSATAGEPGAAQGGPDLDERMQIALQAQRAAATVLDPAFHSRLVVFQACVSAFSRVKDDLFLRASIGWKLAQVLQQARADEQLRTDPTPHTCTTRDETPDRPSQRLGGVPALADVWEASSTKQLLAQTWGLLLEPWVAPLRPQDLVDADLAFLAFRCLTRAGAGAYELMLQESVVYPYRLFGILSAGPKEAQTRATAIIHEARSTPCVLDDFSQKHIKQFTTLTSLLGDLSLACLAASASNIASDTLHVERGHAQVRRHAQQQARLRKTQRRHSADMAFTQQNLSGLLGDTVRTHYGHGKEDLAPTGPDTDQGSRCRGIGSGVESQSTGTGSGYRLLLATAGCRVPGHAPLDRDNFE